MHSESGFRIAPNWPWIRKMTGISQFPDTMSLSNFVDLVLCLLSLVTGPSVMSTTSLVMELWQFSFIRDQPGIQKLETTLCEFCPISGDWDELGISNFTKMSPIKCYWMLQNAMVTNFTVLSYYGKANRGYKITPSPLV